MTSLDAMREMLRSGTLPGAAEAKGAASLPDFRDITKTHWTRLASRNEGIAPSGSVLLEVFFDGDVYYLRETVGRLSAGEARLVLKDELRKAVHTAYLSAIEGYREDGYLVRGTGPAHSNQPVETLTPEVVPPDDERDATVNKKHSEDGERTMMTRLEALGKPARYNGGKRSKKFYMLEIFEYVVNTKGAAPYSRYELLATWGRVGSESPQSMMLMFGTIWSGIQAEYEAKIAQKTRKGYAITRVIDFEDEDDL